MNSHSLMSKPSGFTLIELAVVLFIVMLLLGGLLPTVSSQIEQQRRNETRKQLDDIQQALYGYASIYGYLPCPVDPAITNPNQANYGEAQNNCNSDAAAEGILPWKTLGVSETDAWGSHRTSSSDPWTGYWKYRVDRNFTLSGTFLTTKLATGFVDKLKIADSNNNALTPSTTGCITPNPTSECPVLIVYSTGPNRTADGNNATYEANAAANPLYQSDTPSPAYDDILIWLSRPQIFNRMMSAGKLP